MRFPPCLLLAAFFARPHVLRVRPHALVCNFRICVGYRPLSLFLRDLKGRSRCPDRFLRCRVIGKQRLERIERRRSSRALDTRCC